MARFLRLMAVLVFTAFSTVAFSAPCDPEENSWVPGRYYPTGSTVFHKGKWYESRQLHEGKTPGADFEWKKRASAPDCGNEESRPTATTGQQDESKKPRARGQEQQEPKAKARNNARQACNAPGAWSFGTSYTVGQITSHEGQTYRAIRPTNGQMPGVSKPPHWQPVEHPCKNAPDSGN
ncbi:MAG: carbohydrate-binding protein [Marinobacter sp.]|uniref:carbohydrate-binding protein n=1 Tax=Marinobacter sp. TaxID=50741 RepID=UPI003299F95B